MRFVLLALASTLVFAACGKKSSKKDDTTDQGSQATIGYPDLSGMDELPVSSSVAIEKSCYSHEWKRMLLPKGIDIHTGSDLVKSKIYVEVSSDSCLGLIPVVFESGFSNLATLQFNNAILKTECSTYGEHLNVPFRYLQMTDNGKRGFAFQLDENDDFCEAGQDDNFSFSER